MAHRLRLPEFATSPFIRQTQPNYLFKRKVFGLSAYWAETGIACPCLDHGARLGAWSTVEAKKQAFSGPGAVVPNPKLKLMDQVREVMRPRN